MKKSMMALLALCCAAGAMAAEIVVSMESNGVLRAEGLEPGSSFTVEWASCLTNAFTNNPAPFAGLTADSNGVGSVAIPMFFRVSGTPSSTNAAPEGMVLIPAGTNSGTDPDFGAYSLTVTNAFYMDATEVTKAQWDAVYNWAVAHGYSFDNVGSGKAANHPVHTVSWYDVVKWCNARSEMEGRTPCYTVSGSPYKTGQSAPVCNFEADGFRLPTSDEWEYAARGGLQGKRFPWGDTITHSQANYYSSSSYSYDTSSTRGYHSSYATGGDPYTSPAGDFAANGYGLYDMTGNVWECCYAGSDRVVRGGCCVNDASGARCGFVIGLSPVYSDCDVGFRSVLPAK
ncbi:MAG: formylglycine-generating enzyme family protein [Lentisphaerae bacterium]|nr:formylglycine-generating enzyme family protein [Lentisphaerota bacterium]